MSLGFINFLETHIIVKVLHKRGPLTNLAQNKRALARIQTCLTVYYAFNILQAPLDIVLTGTYAFTMIESAPYAEQEKHRSTDRQI